jgi:transposase-like protein
MECLQQKTGCAILRKKYTDEDKQNVINIWTQTNLTVREIADKTEINRGTVGRWIRGIEKKSFILDFTIPDDNNVDTEEEVAMIKEIDSQKEKEQEYYSVESEQKEIGYITFMNFCKENNDTELCAQFVRNEKKWHGIIKSMILIFQEIKR